MRITGQEKVVWGRRAASTALLAVIVGVFLPVRAEAIPAFARKYQFSCSTCHAPVPRLKPFGEAFAARGFRLEDPAQEPPRATHDTGDPTLRLMRELPLAFRLDGYASWKENEAAETDTEFPWAFKILSGGQIHERISYYMYFILEKGGVQGLEDAWLQFNTPLNLPINVTVGQFQVCDPLFKREARLERYDYDIFGTRVGASPINLTYDRGVIASWSFPGAVDTVVQVVNGNGIREADGAGNFDEDGLKNVSLRLARTFNRVRLGAFSYWGKTRGTDGDNRTYYIGPDVIVSFSDQVQLNLQYLERRDDNPLFLAARGAEWQTRGGFAELVFLPRGADGKYSIAGLYNKVDSDDPEARRETISATFGYLFARNVRGVVEAGRDVERGAARFSVGVVSAF